MNIVPGIIRRIKLHNPVHGGNVKASSGNICTYQGALLGIAELEKGIGPFLLFLLAVEVENWQINVVEQLGVVFDAIAGGKEDDDFLLEVALEKGEQEQEAFVGVANHIALLESLDRAVLFSVVHIDVQWAGPE